MPLRRLPRSFLSLSLSSSRGESTLCARADPLVPRVSDLHTSGQFPIRLDSFRLVAPVLSYHSASPSLSFSLLPPSCRGNNPFSRRRRQKRGSARKNGGPRSSTTMTFPGETVPPKQRVYCGTTSLGVVADVVVFCAGSESDRRKRKARSAARSRSSDTKNTVVILSPRECCRRRRFRRFSRTNSINNIHSSRPMFSLTVFIVIHHYPC